MAPLAVSCKLLGFMLKCQRHGHYNGCNRLVTIQNGAKRYWTFSKLSKSTLKVHGYNFQKFPKVLNECQKLYEITCLKNPNISLMYLSNL